MLFLFFRARRKNRGKNMVFEFNLVIYSTNQNNFLFQKTPIRLLLVEVFSLFSFFLMVQFVRLLQKLDS